MKIVNVNVIVVKETMIKLKSLLEQSCDNKLPGESNATEDEDDELDELGPIGMAVGRAVGRAVAGAAVNKVKDKLMSQKDDKEEKDDE